MGGEFLSHLITSSLSNQPFDANPTSNGKYIFSRNVEKIPDNLNLVCPQNPQLIFAIHKNPDFKEYLKSISLLDNNTRREQHLVDHYFLYEYVKDEDDTNVIENIQKLLRRMIPIPDTFRVMTFHSLTYDTPGLGMKDIFPGSINIRLDVCDKSLSCIFDFLCWFKNQTSRNLDKDAVTMNHIMTMDKTYTPNPSIHQESIFYVEDLFFDDNFVKLKKHLSSMIGTDVNVDENAINKYRSDNKSIISKFFDLNSGVSVTDQSTLTLIRNFLNLEHENYRVKIQQGLSR